MFRVTAGSNNNGETKKQKERLKREEQEGISKTRFVRSLREGWEEKLQYLLAERQYKKRLIPCLELVRQVRV
jgi:hypothetical protein